MNQRETMEQPLSAQHFHSTCERQKAALTKHSQSEMVGPELLLHTARGVIPPPGQGENYVSQAVLTS